MDLVLQYKNTPDETPKLSVDEYLKLENPLQKELYELIPKQDALQHKLNFIAHLLKTYKHTVVKAKAIKITNINNKAYGNITHTEKYDSIDDIDNIIKLVKDE